MTMQAQGWQVFPAEPAVASWLSTARPAALAAARAASAMARALRHGGTWLAGVDMLDNDSAGRVGQGGALSGAALGAAEAVSGRLPLHRAQVSVTHPGYPGRDASESETAFRYRLTRDAAHLDGLLPEGPDKRRHLREPHGFILGIALTEASRGAAPLVVYEGSHVLMRAAFRAVFKDVAPQDWGDVDVTEAYQAARRRCFHDCPRVEIPLSQGQSVLVHRLALHGIAPWAEGATAGPDGRAIAYFRPVLPRIADWLDLP
jgi:hypothetical protein